MGIVPPIVIVVAVTPGVAAGPLPSAIAAAAAARCEITETRA